VVDEIIRAIEEARDEARRQIFVIGNGGSAATASHMMNDLCKGTLGHKGDAPWPRLRVIALTDNVSLMTAWANDTDYNPCLQRAAQEPRPTRGSSDRDFGVGEFAQYHSRRSRRRSKLA
jgi:phosphoheptose isomerase